MKNLKPSLKAFYTSNTIIVKYLLLVIVFTFINSCSTYRVNRLKNKSYKKWKSFQWTETKKSSDKDTAGWTIYSRKIKGTDFLEYKIEGEIASSPEFCLATFKQDIYHQANKKNNKKYPTYKIINESPDSVLTYVVHNEPFPFKDTEMRVKYVFSTNADGSKYVKWKESWDKGSIGTSKKLNRVETFRGSWEFAVISENRVNATNIVQFDPKGMPKVLVQPMVTKFLKKGLENLRDTTK